MQFASIGKLLWHTNNYARDRRAGQVMQAMGVVAGSPDLMMFYKGKLYAFELKSAKGRQNTAQKEWQKQFEEQGGDYYIIRDVMQFVSVVTKIIKW